MEARIGEVCHEVQMSLDLAPQRFWRWVEGYFATIIPVRIVCDLVGRGLCVTAVRGSPEEACMCGTPCFQHILGLGQLPTEIPPKCVSWTFWIHMLASTRHLWWSRTERNQHSRANFN